MGFAVWLLVLAKQIQAAGEIRPSGKADAAIVLGAAVYGREPSPVFAERIRHGIRLYRGGTVRTLIFTGGDGGGGHAESLVAKRIAISSGVPGKHVLTEAVSRTTRTNLLHAHRLMREHGLRSALVVSDPLHIKRALRMSKDLGIAAEGAPTPTSRYRSWRGRMGFLLRELYFYHHYLLTGS
ncbi:YdcF family protein [Sphingomonas sp. GCM10030256]|uniref:YdcF family protein n=1 Tax=Sphingomonas sp. GCM10030256 TaxID=3273427 RepID=UPI00360F9284